MSKQGIILAVGLLIGGCGAAEQSTVGNAVSGGEIKLLSDRITLPEEDAALPVGSDRIAAACTACHSAEMLTAQPRLTPEKWQATIDKMRTVYKAEVAPADDAALIAELTALPAQRVGTGSALE